MVRPERRNVLAGESPVWVRAGTPSSRLQPRGEIRPGRAECRKPLYKEGEQTSGPQQSVNAIASSHYQPKGVWESRAAHVTAKATDSIPDRNGCWISPGSQAVARWDRTVRNRRDPTWQPRWAKAEHIRSEGRKCLGPGGSPRGPSYLRRRARQHAGGKGPCFDRACKEVSARACR
jgi:hypothetical protein